MFDVFYIGKPPGLFPYEQGVATIEEACQRSRTRYCWVISYLCDYTGFDFLWEPPPWQAHQRHAWSSQWQKDSGTYLVPRSGYQDTNYHTETMISRRSDDRYWQQPEMAIEGFDYSWHPDPTDPPYIYQFGTQHQKTGGPRYITPGAVDVKYVDQLRANTLCSTDTIYVIDYLNGSAQQLASDVSAYKTVRYFDNYLDTLRRIAKNAHAEHQEFVWVISSVCDYQDFDFSWHPEQWQATMLHVFASGNEKFGDTFFMHVPTFAQRSERCQLLEWYDVNFVKNKSVPRLPIPVIKHDYDNQIDAVRASTCAGPLALFTNHAYIAENIVPVVPLWREKTRTIVPLDPGGESVIVPRDAVPRIKTQLYDYPHIDKTHYFLKSRPLDIVFIDNGEHGADHHWKLLNQTAQGCRIHRVTGVNGRVAAYQAAARLSETDWFFAVFAKLQVNEDFDWRWQPDRLQQAKHYIFHAYNPVNHLTYGHQAMIAYNRRLVLENTGQGLDFTLDQPHEVVPIVSGTAYYDNDPWTCWRTAFREVIKLRHSLPDVENDYRLQQWLSVGEGINGHWSTIGANDALNYYDSVGGDFNEIKKSYEWSWLASYAMIVHPELVTQSKT